ncbi:hypothetical protein [Streptomyces sp. NPDC007264]|uniref:hypothetical protein n=1 Tax=Streptomyces sp. NPDC007264 TaxID=3364777 RepID=UPI0036DB514B
MSAGLAIPSLDLVAPAVTFPPPPPPVGDFVLPHTGASPLTHGFDVSQAASHGAGAALHVLESLSGFLLVGRAALLTTRVLAQAAVRAADELHCLERQEEIAAALAEQWQAAAYAAARANARRTALLCRMRRVRTTGGGGDGEAPPQPDLPPPLEPVGCELGTFRRELARFEDHVRRAEEIWTAWEIRRLTAVVDTAVSGVDTDGADDAWGRMLRDRQAAMLARHMESRTADAEQREEQPSAVPSRITPEQAHDIEAVRHVGAGILAALDPQADPRTAVLAAAAVGNAVRKAADSPTRAQRHLNDARRVVRDANRDAEARRAQAEWAAAQLDFLTRKPPEYAEPLPEAPDAVAALHRVLDDGVLLGATERRLVEQRVRERHDHLAALYVYAQCSEVFAELAERHGGLADTSVTQGRELRLDWTPEGWEPDHWLRATLVDGTFRVATMYRGAPGERSRKEQELDDARCEEARQRLDEFAELARELGLTVHFRIEQVKGARPGLPGEDAISLDDLGRLPAQDPRGEHRRRDERPTRRERTVGDDDRR